LLLTALGWLVSVLINRNATPGIAAPLGSVTDPVIEPVAVCAGAVAANTTARVNIAQRNRYAPTLFSRVSIF
jgi:hypothetical protein